MSGLASARHPPGFLELRGRWPAPAALWAATGNSFFTSAAAARLLYSYRAITEGERLLQCCTACSYLSIFSLHCSISPSSIHRLQYCSTSISEPSLNHSQCRHTAELCGSSSSATLLQPGCTKIFNGLDLTQFSVPNGTAGGELHLPYRIRVCLHLN